MAYTVPNRPDTTSADLAEPDKGDFQSLGNRKSGVLSGGVVTRSASNTLSVTAVTGYLAGEYFSISGPNSLDLNVPSASGLAKFILVLVRKVGSNFTVTTQSTGGESATNAVYPALDDATELLLAVAYYPTSATDIASSGIVDKRSFILPQANPTAATTTPPDAEGALGEIRIDSSIGVGATGQSNVWVKTATTGTSRWTNLASYTVQTPQNGFVPVSPVHHYRTDTGVVIGGSAPASNTGNTHGGVAYTLLVDGTAKITGALSCDSLTLGGSNVSVNSNWANKRKITLSGQVEGESAEDIDGSSDITISNITVSGFLPLTGSADGGPPMEGAIATQNVYPVSNANPGMGSGYWLGTPFLQYQRVYLAEQPVVGSDVALKQDFTDTPGLPFLNDLKPMSYRLKTHPDERHWGFVAQDVEQSCDEHGVEDAAVYSRVDGAPMALMYGELMAPMVKAIQELSERLEAIENG